MKLKYSALALLVLLGLGPTALEAQACLGIPGSRDLAVEAGYQRAEKLSIYSGRVSAPLPVGGWVGGSYGLVTADSLYQAGHRFAIATGVELATHGLSICPVAAVEHTRNFEYEMVLDSLAVVLDMYETRTTRFDFPVGVAAGYTLRLPGGLSITPSGFLGKRWSRWRIRGLEVDEVDRQDWVRGSVLTLGWRNLYIRASRWPERIPDSEPEHHFSIGFRPSF